MTTFKSYDDLVGYLKGYTDLCMVLRYLLDQVTEEANFLVKSNLPARAKKEEKKAALLKYMEQAQEDYLEEINTYLETDADLSSMSVMGYRRKVHAWAIADSIKEYRKVMEEQ